MSKAMLTFDEIDAQAAVELPPREALALVNVFVPIYLSDINVIAQVPIGVAANVCNVPVAVLSNQVFTPGTSACTATSTAIPTAFVP